MKTKLIDNIFELVSCDNDSFYELSRAPLAYQYFRNTFKNIKNGDFLPEIFEEDCSSFKWFGLVETDKVSLETSSVLSNAFEMFSNNMIQYCIFLGFELLYEIHKKSYNKQSVINGMFYYAEMEIPLRHLYVKCLIGLKMGDASYILFRGDGLLRKFYNKIKSCCCKITVYDNTGRYSQTKRKLRL